MNLRPRCYVCGEAVGKEFVLFSLNEVTDRVFIGCQPCVKKGRLDKEANILGVKSTKGGT